MDEPRMLLKDAVGFTGVWRDVYFESYASPADLPTYRARARAQLDFFATLPPTKKVVSFHVVKDMNVKPVDGELRQTMHAHAAATAARLKGAVVVVSSTGFRAAVVRGVIAALLMASGAKHPTRTAGSVEDAALWAATLLDEPATVADVLRAHAWLAAQ